MKAACVLLSLILFYNLRDVECNRFWGGPFTAIFDAFGPRPIFVYHEDGFPMSNSAFILRLQVYKRRNGTPEEVLDIEHERENQELLNSLIALPGDYHLRSGKRNSKLLNSSERLKLLNIHKSGKRFFGAALRYQNFPSPFPAADIHRYGIEHKKHLTQNGIPLRTSQITKTDGKDERSQIYQKRRRYRKPINIKSRILPRLYKKYDEYKDIFTASRGRRGSFSGKL